MVREPNNSRYSNAVALLWKSGEKLGYLRRNIAAHTAPLMNHGCLYIGRQYCVIFDRMTNGCMCGSRGWRREFMESADYASSQYIHFPLFVLNRVQERFIGYL